MTKKSKMQWITPRRLGGLGCLLGLALAAAFVVVLYQQVRSLFGARQYGPPSEEMATQDVPVQRGSIADGIMAYGQIAPARQAALGFRVARGKIVEVLVQPGQSVQAGNPLVRLDRAALERELAKVRADLLDARRELAKLDALGGAAQQARLEVELRDARAKLDEARRELAAFDAGSGTPEYKLATARAELANARATLVAVRDSRQRRKTIEALEVAFNAAAVEHGPYVLITNPSEQDRDKEWFLRVDMLQRRDALETARLQYGMDVRAAEHKVTVRERAVRDAERQVTSGGAPIARAKLAAAVKVAEASVLELEARLTALRQGAADATLAKAQAEVVKLEGKAADAEAALSEAELVAPFAGVVEEVKQKPGDAVSSGAAVVTVLDLSAVRIVARVPDVDVARLKAGQEARVAFDAFRGLAPVACKLGDIPLYGKYEQGATFFDVPVAFEAAEIPLQVGMTANIFIPLERKENVLLIPVAALQSDGQESFVWLVQGQKVARRNVRLGIVDGVMAEVLEGLRQGDVVRMPLQGPGGPGMMGVGG